MTYTELPDRRPGALRLMRTSLALLTALAWTAACATKPHPVNENAVEPSTETTESVPGADAISVPDEDMPVVCCAPQ